MELVFVSEAPNGWECVVPPARLKSPTPLPEPPSGCHAIERAWQRYGTRLKWKDLNQIVHAIQNNEGKLLSHSPGETSEWLLTYKDVEYRVVISADFWTVVTFLPPVTERKPPRRKMVYKNGQPRWVISNELE